MSDPIIVTLHENDLLALMEIITHYKLLYYWTIRQNSATLTEERKDRLAKIEAVIKGILKM